MTRFKDFGSGPALAEVEPLSFKLYDEEFNCLPRVQGALLLDLVAKTREDGGAGTAEVILRFFKQVLEDESYERFDKMINGKEHFVDVETMGEIIGWLMEEYTNRPEKRAGVS